MLPELSTAILYEFRPSGVLTIRPQPATHVSYSHDVTTPVLFANTQKPSATALSALVQLYAPKTDEQLFLAHEKPPILTEKLLAE